MKPLGIHTVIRNVKMTGPVRLFAGQTGALSLGDTGGSVSAKYRGD